MHAPSEAPRVVEDDAQRRGDRSVRDDTDHEERDHRRILCPALAAPVVYIWSVPEPTYDAFVELQQLPQMEPAR